MDIFTVSMFGHRVLTAPDRVEEALETLVRELLCTKEYVEFLVGRDGAFDLLAASVVRRCRKVIREDNSALILVLPYMTAEYRDNTASFEAYFDAVEICADAAKGHYKAAHQTRNRQMVDRSDLAVFCVEHPSGGAYQTLQYAIKQGCTHRNLANLS